jgi:hypothetical protein
LLKRKSLPESISPNQIHLRQNNISICLDALLISFATLREMLFAQIVVHTKPQRKTKDAKRTIRLRPIKGASDPEERLFSGLLIALQFRLSLSCGAWCPNLSGLSEIATVAKLS